LPGFGVVLDGESQLGTCPGPSLSRERVLVRAGVRLAYGAARVAKPGQRDPSNGRVLDAQA
jgi:hypothetical protein